jgi:hypothetical protein
VCKDGFLERWLAYVNAEWRKTARSLNFIDDGVIGFGVQVRETGRCARPSCISNDRFNKALRYVH